MGTALTLFVLLSISIFVMRVAAVALRITGMSQSNARFQALSAFTGTGYTTGEAEMIVNYPIRRRIVSWLMVVGNLGLVSVLATLVSSLVRVGGDIDAVATQMIWLIAGLVVLWILILNKNADRILCGLISRILERTTFLGRRSYNRLLQLSDGVSICEHAVPVDWQDKSPEQVVTDLQQYELKFIAVLLPDGTAQLDDFSSLQLNRDQRLVLLGRDRGHDAVGGGNDGSSK